MEVLDRPRDDSQPPTEVDIGGYSIESFHKLPYTTKRRDNSPYTDIFGNIHKGVFRVFVQIAELRKKNPELLAQLLPDT